MRFYPILLASPLSEGQRDERVPWSTSYLTPLQMRDDLNRSNPAWSRSHRITRCRSVMDTADHIWYRQYEPIFEDSSHGFRPGRSPHTALEQIGQKWTAVKWIIDMDIRSYFDSMNHDLLLSF